MVPLGLKIPAHAESAEPNNLAAACDHGPALLFLADDMPVLQQLLDFFRFFGVRRPEALARAPVAD